VSATSSRVFDSSATLAVIHAEPGADAARAALAGSIMSAVNLAEVVAKLCEQGCDEALARSLVEELGLEVVPLSAATAWTSGLLREATRSAGLPLGDRACLALAIELGLPALTADKRWSAVRTKAKVELIR
jgi:ribonuclease VapC